MKSRTSLLLLFVIVFGTLSAFQLASAGGTSCPTATVYIGVPQGTVATYFERYAYTWLYSNGSLNKTVTSGYYNATLGFTLSGYIQSLLNVPVEASLLISVQNVAASKGFNSTYARAQPPLASSSETLQEYTGNISIAPYYLISPNAPDGSITRYNGINLNISVTRLSAYPYSQGAVSLKGGAIEMTSLYENNYLGKVSERAVRVYDAGSGLLVYYTNLTSFAIKTSTGTIYTLLNTTEWLTSTSLNTLDASGTVTPSVPTLSCPTKSASSSIMLVLVGVLVVLIIVMVALVIFGRRR
jgi:hypothetical protein